MNNSNLKNMYVKEFENSTSNLVEFDNFIDNSINGTVFHKKAFLNYHPQDRFNDNTLQFFKKGKLIALFPAAKMVHSDGKTTLKSHPGSSYGGLVIEKNMGIASTFELIDALIEYAQSKDFDFIEFRLPEKIFYNSNLDNIDFCLLHRGFYREAEELSNCIELTQFKDLDFDKFVTKFRADSLYPSKNKVDRNYRHSLSYNLTADFTKDKNDIEQFYQVLTQTLTKFNTKPVHTLSELNKILDTFSDTHIFVVKFNDKVIAGQFLLKVNNNGYHMFYNAMDYEYQNMRPANFGMLQLIYKLSQNGEKYYNLGISTEKGGKFINYGLFDFKESFNSEGILRTYWKKEL